MNHFSLYSDEHKSLLEGLDSIRVEVEPEWVVCANILQFCYFQNFHLKHTFVYMSDNTEELVGVALNNYRQGKELFSINVYGCSLSDILLTILIVPFLFGIYHEICDLLFKGSVFIGYVNITNSGIEMSPEPFFSLYISF